MAKKSKNIFKKMGKSLKKIKNPFAKFTKPLNELLKIFPAILGFLKFTLLTIPKFIRTVFKQGTKFVRRSIPLLFAIIIMYFFIFLGTQIFLKHVTDTPDLVPHVPLMLFTAYMIYQMVMSDSGILQTIQNLIFRIFLFIFGNPLIRRYIKFKWPFKGNEKPTIKNIALLSKWIIFHPLHVASIIFIYYIIIKFFIVKFSSEILAFFKILIENLFGLVGIKDIFNFSIGKYLATHPIQLIVLIALLFGIKKFLKK